MMLLPVASTANYGKGGPVAPPWGRQGSEGSFSLTNRNRTASTKTIKANMAGKQEKTVFIDDEDYYVINHERFFPWFTSVVATIFDQDMEQHEMPYYLFCAGAEAALRCQQIDKIH